ncbi:MAG: ABC transporter permease subunit [Mahellales bacterium]|jgi:ABC-2 type transport system permease protein
MRRQAMAAIIKKDIKAVSDNVQIWLPIIIVPLVFTVVLPIIIILLTKSQGLAQSSAWELPLKLLDKIPMGTMQDEINSLSTLQQKVIFIGLNYMFLPLFLLIPAMVSSTVAANSFVGEKERKTMETLLYSPISEVDLFISKVLAPFITSMVVTILCFIIYGIVVNLLSYDIFGGIIFPRPNWYLTAFLLSPAVSVLSIFFNVYISARVKGFQEAYQLGAMVVLPILAIFYSQLMGVFFLSNGLIVVISLAFFAVSALLILSTGKSFNRNKLFESQIK